MTTYGLLIFDDAEELDFTGPWEVFTASAMLRDQADTARADQPSGPVRFAAPRACACCPTTRSPTIRRWTSCSCRAAWARAARSRTPRSRTGSGPCRPRPAWTTSVCTGALLLHEAGPARGRRVATHHAFEETSQERGDITVISDARYVVDGTSGDQPGRLGRDRHGAVAYRGPARPRSFPRGPPLHPVQARAAVPGRRAGRLRARGASEQQALPGGRTRRGGWRTRRGGRAGQDGACGRDGP